ncbi:MAG: chain length determinant protein EpsF [Burkholderiaceae bacterium]|jgi:chain length determinant protein EpsF
MTIHQFLRTLIARRWMIVLTIITLFLLLGLLIFLVPPRYTATASVVVNSQSQDPLMGALLQTPIGATYVITQAEVIGSPRVAKRVVSKLNLAQDPTMKEAWQDDTHGRGDFAAWIGDLLLSGLKVQPGRESNVIEINYKSRDPVFAATLANAFAQAYLETSMELKVAPAKQSARLFDSRIAEVRSQLEQAQQKLADAQKDAGMVVTPERIDVENARLADLSTQLVMAQGQMADASSRNHGAEGNVASSPDVIQNGVVQGLKTQIALSESKLKELSGRLGPNHPEYIRTQQEVNDLRASLARESAQVGSSLGTADRIGASRVGQLQAAVNSQRQRIIALSQARDGLSVLQREVDNAQKAYDLVMQRYSQTSVESQVAQSDVALLTAATEPIEPSFPKVKLYSVLTLGMGILLGIGLALLAEVFNPMVHGALDITSRVGIPVFAVVPNSRLGRKRWGGILPAPRRDILRLTR